jgi:lipopolysaccharide transport system ATP-binding protein
MSDIAIRVENLSKLYRIRERRRYRTLRDAITGMFAGSLRRAGKTTDGRQTTGDGSFGLRSRVASPQPSIFSPRFSIRKWQEALTDWPSAIRHLPSETIWALKDVSFEIKHGEVVGIIGGNGAGKSTLLKILSRITEPTEGEARIYGRVGSLLDVGTGFHPELTGRENIYLNGAILGMKKKEIDKKFDEIVAFAEIEKFIDTPVKHYSSGLYMRLAFSVAAHLEPEILIVDEVLAVGDAAFQKKCLGKMGEVAKEGRTVLFVSHNMAAVENLCGRSILLRFGKVVADAAPSEAIAEYLGSFAAAPGDGQLESIKRDPGLVPVIQRLDFLDQTGRQVRAVQVGAPVTVRIHYKHSQPIKRPYFGLIFETMGGVKVFWVQSRLQGGDLPDLPAVGVVVCHIPRLPLVPGVYFIQPGCGTGTTQLDLVPRVCQLQVTEADVFGTGRLPNAAQGLVVVDAAWEASLDSHNVQEN